ncbi:MAG: pyruvate kinase [Gemmatimonadales bacterium]|nr:pyruvate kinase [Gemmatimonadales bacterium]HRX18196.1 pyruvate kinase [Gemmatimonadales bacterium]
MPGSEIRRTKIVATMGPAWEDESHMRGLLEAGVNMVRVNASHGTPEKRAAWIRSVQAMRSTLQRPTGILVDLHGPRIRVGKLPEAITISQGQQVVFAPEESAQEGEIPTTYAALAGDVSKGSRILLDDGLLAVEVTAVRGDRVEGTVQYGGLLKPNKGMNLPGADVSAPAVTEADAEEVQRVAALGVEYIGVSFVRRAEDLERVRAMVPKTVRLIAKIEKDTALDHLDEILEATDAMMVARGDLGVELPFEQVPLVQKRLIQRANRHGKPVITATQMLESMVTNPRPTRAEASDVANAIIDGTDAVMLSAETAVGSYPMEAVRAMDRIAREVEGVRLRPSDGERRRWQVPAPHFARTVEGSIPTEDAISVAVALSADMLGAKAIVCFTSSGFTARTVSSYRPRVPIFALTAEPETYQQLALSWGVVPVMMPHLKNYDPMWNLARAQLLSGGVVEEGDRVVVTCGVPFDIPGTTNLLKVETV